MLLVLAWISLIVTLAVGVVLYLANMMSDGGRSVWWPMWVGTAFTAAMFAAHHFHW